MKKKLISNSIIAIFLILAMILPTIFMNRRPGKLSETENRYLAVFPQIFSEDGTFTLGLASNLHSWFNDNLGFRSPLISLSSYIDVKLLHRAPNDKVEFGKDGWFFYTQDSNLAIAAQTYPSFDEKILQQICNQQVRIQQKLAVQGIEYVLILPASKASIYPEKIASGNYSVCQTPADLLADYLETHSDIKVVRLKDALLEEKEAHPDRQLYFKTDTHWNEYGSYIGYQKILSCLNKWGLMDTSAAQVTFEMGTYQGEFAAMMGDVSLLNPEETPISSITHANAEELNEGDLYQEFQEELTAENVHTTGRIFQNDQISDTRVLMYGDSMFASWNASELLAENSSEFYYVWDYNIRQEMIDCVKPDIVFYDIGERYLNYLPTKSVSFTQAALNSPDAQIISQDIPAKIIAGEPVTFFVTVKNTGTQAWSETDAVRLGIFLNGADCGVRAYISSGDIVAPGETYTFTFADLFAPSAGATMEFYMLQEGITYFGERVPADTQIENP